MAKHSITITYEGVEQWQDTEKKVYEVLEKDTGITEYPATRTLPPIIIGPQVTDWALGELKKLPGVIVREQEDD